MSASLVGSEMCIRDRCPTAQSSASCSPACHARAPASGVRWILSHRAQCACLLYTSDAADDM
eukprot:4842651-Alexandrium_andersonii.AAC.1